MSSSIWWSAWQAHLVISQTNSLKVIHPLPSWSTSPTSSLSSPSVGLQPNVLMTWPSSTVVMVPPPSLRSGYNRPGTDFCLTCRRMKIFLCTQEVYHQRVHPQPAKLCTQLWPFLCEVWACGLVITSIIIVPTHHLHQLALISTTTIPVLSQTQPFSDILHELFPLLYPNWYSFPIYLDQKYHAVFLLKDDWSLPSRLRQ